MLIHVRNKDDNKLQYVGIALRQWNISDGSDKKLRIYVLCPHDTKSPGYCDVDVLIEEVSEWKIVGTDKEFGNRRLDDDELHNFSRRVEDDLYYVWDDGASEQMKRAQRLYDSFRNEIDQLGPDAKTVRQEASETLYEQEVAEAKENGWDWEGIPRPAVKGNFGRVG